MRLFSGSSISAFGSHQFPPPIHRTAPTWQGVSVLKSNVLGEWGRRKANLSATLQCPDLRPHTWSQDTRHARVYHKPHPLGVHIWLRFQVSHSSCEGHLCLWYSKHQNWQMAHFLQINKQSRFRVIPTTSSEKAMATHSSTLAWRIPGTGEPGGLPSIGSRRVGHDWSNLATAAAAAGLSLQHQQRRQQQPTPVLLPGESQGVGCRPRGRTESDTTEAT